MNDVAILRRCRRCAAYRSIDHFAPLGKLCRDCASSHGSRPPTDYLGLSRGLVLTPKGRATLAALRLEEVAA